MHPETIRSHTNPFIHGTGGRVMTHTHTGPAPETLVMVVVGGGGRRQMQSTQRGRVMGSRQGG